MEAYYYPMSTKKRHNRIISTLIGDVLDSLRKKEIDAFHEECSLVFYGKQKIPDSICLIDVSKIEDINHFRDKVMGELRYVQPDFVMFKANPYIENHNETLTAGQPDLIVEVWSEGNTKNDRAFLQYLYATSDVTEHWYIEQDSNKVECYMGNERLPDQCLTNILKTQNGMEFDLRYLAI